MIFYTTPEKLVLQDFVCIDVGQKKTGIAYNFAHNRIAFTYRNVKTENTLKSLKKLQCRYIIVGLPFAYPESESYYFIISFTNFLQHNLPDYNFIFWDETSSSQKVREEYKYERKGFSKNFYKNYDTRCASVILESFLSSI